MSCLFLCSYKTATATLIDGKGVNIVASLCHAASTQPDFEGLLHLASKALRSDEGKALIKELRPKTISLNIPTNGTVKN